MKTILKNVTVLDSSSPYYKMKKDILLEEGIYQTISDHIAVTEDMEVFESNDLHISQSWVDLKADFRDPGKETEEDLSSGIAVATSGGFGHVFVTPNTSPTTDNKGQALYIQSKNENHTTHLYPIGAITKDLKGKDLSEMYDLFKNGVSFYSNGDTSLAPEILYRALLYARRFGGQIISFPQESAFLFDGQVNEGVAAVKTGLKGIPEVGESIQIQRDIRLAIAADTSIHLSGISTLDSVEQIRKAKKEGASITCDVYAQHLLFNEEKVTSFDTNYKVLPPYRREKDRLALWEGLRDGTIDCIVSNHQPRSIETKETVFDHADFGIISLQTFYPSLLTVASSEQELIIDKISIAPRILADFNTDTSIEEGNKVDCTLFDPSIEWTFNKESNRSKSSNSPFYGQQLKGKVLAVMKGKKRG